MQTTGIAELNGVSWWFDTLKWSDRKCSICADWILPAFLHKVWCFHGIEHVLTEGPNTGGCQREQGYLVQGGSLPVSFASLQYLSFRTNAAALGCLCLLKTPFLFPTTRVIPADTRGSTRISSCTGRKNSGAFPQANMQTDKKVWSNSI